MVESITPRTGAADPCAEGYAPIVVLGIGNLLWADEGFGVRCVEALGQRWDFAPHVQLVDGGTQGLYLLHHVQAARQLLIFDAIDYGLEPGTLKVVRDKDVPRFLGAKKMSLHQTGFQEVLSLAQLTGHYPERVLLVGCQPQELEDYGGSLRPVVRAAMEQALALGVEALRDWGAEPRARDGAAAEVDGVTLPSLALERYEGGRPTAEAACRVGDARFMPAAPAGD
ncbi:HyaD/HybD family hydrogenase maturation endopeptidase [Azohydromonas lata]|uniref:HyaD/HybD family hydrogenase maturation endopeptidase n=1 Tax=Azohydromonas lata TaxID=45677 RepID=UPI000A06CB47|nr:HyaD/HybD family hydrogenase maturation endopeptidase [Azohydromonas lata]